MKKVLFIAAAVLAMSACNKMETVNVSNPAEIGFFTMAQNATKGYIPSTAFYQYDNPNNVSYDSSLKYRNTVAPGETATSRDMVVNAYNVTDGDNYFTAPVTFKESTKVEDGTGSGVWHATPAMYWPIGKDLSFLAYSSQNITGRPEPVAKWDGAKKVSFDITAEQCYQNDIVYAQAKGNNRGTAAGNNGSDSANGLPLHFYHAQAWITFNVTTTGTDNTVTDAIDVTNIVLENVYNSGVLTFTYDEAAEANPATAQPKATWNFFTQNPTDVSVDDPYNAFGANMINKDGDYNGIQLNMLMPAQKHNDFVLYYTANGIEDSVVLPFGGNAFSSGTAENSDNGKWEMGKHYIYNIQISINELTFAPDVKTWVDVTGFATDPQVI